MPRRALGAVERSASPLLCLETPSDKEKPVDRGNPSHQQQVGGKLTRIHGWRDADGLWRGFARVPATHEADLQPSLAFPLQGHAPLGVLQIALTNQPLAQERMADEEPGPEVPAVHRASVVRHDVSPRSAGRGNEHSPVNARQQVGLHGPPSHARRHKVPRHTQRRAAAEQESS